MRLFQIVLLVICFPLFSYTKDCNINVWSKDKQIYKAIEFVTSSLNSKGIFYQLLSKEISVRTDYPENPWDNTVSIPYIISSGINRTQTVKHLCLPNGIVLSMSVLSLNKRNPFIQG